MIYSKRVCEHIYKLKIWSLKQFFFFAEFDSFFLIFLKWQWHNQRLSAAMMLIRSSTSANLPLTYILSVSDAWSPFSSTVAKCFSSSWLKLSHISLPLTDSLHLKITILTERESWIHICWIWLEANTNWTREKMMHKPKQWCFIPLFLSVLVPIAWLPKDCDDGLLEGFGVTMQVASREPPMLNV